MCGTETEKLVQLVPQERLMFRFVIVKVVAGFWDCIEMENNTAPISKSFLIDG